MRGGLGIKSVREDQIIVGEDEENIESASTKLVSKEWLLNFPEEIRLGGSDGEEELRGRHREEFD